MKNFLILPLLLILTTSLTIFSNSIETSSLSSDTSSTHPLGHLNIDDVLKLQITFPNPTKSLPNMFAFILLNTEMQQSIILAGNFSMVYLVPSYPKSMSPIEGTITKEGNYKLDIRPLSTIRSVQIVQIEIFVNGVLRSKIVDMPRNSPYKLIYVSQPQFVTITKTQGLVELYSMKSTNKLEISTGRYRGNLSPQMLLLQPGYYLLRLKLELQSKSASKLSYQSDPYPCPYSQQYEDVARIFEPCTPNTICPPGQNLVEGKCVCQESRDRKNSRCVCKSGLKQRKGKCVCPNNESPDESGKCACSAGQIRVGASCKCRQNRVREERGCVCQAGFSQVQGECQCISGEISQTGECVSSIRCPFGFELIKGECICPPGREIKRGMCICPKGLVNRRGNCVSRN